MSNVYMHSSPDPENLKGMQGKKNHTHAHKYSLKLSHTRAPTHTHRRTNQRSTRISRRHMTCRSQLQRK